MAAETGGSTEPPKPDGAKGQVTEGQAQPAAAAGAVPPAEKKLTNAELKKKAKEEKAARRAKAAQAGPPAASGAANQAQQADGKGHKSKPKQDGQQQQHGKLPVRPNPTATTTSAAATAVKDTRPKVPECFSHLSMAKRIHMTQADKDVHPAVLVLGQHMSTFAISDSITRLEATLRAFKQVIDSYTTAHGTSFSRHFTSHVLNPQIEYLTACRPMCFSMGNAIRWLKLQISKIDIDLPDQDAKDLLGLAIKNFINERIEVASGAIADKAAKRVQDGQTILTYAHHHLVERAFLEAKAEGKHFKVILVDDPYERVGIAHAKTLAAAGIEVVYATDFGAIRTNIIGCSSVLVAGEAVFSNGAVYARAGTCDIAMAALDAGVAVTALCETINFTERMSIDSLTYNEMDPERYSDTEFRLLFDTTRYGLISTVLTELGDTSPTSVPAILRKLEEL